MVLTAPNVHERIRATAKVSARPGGHDLTFQAMATHCRVSFAANSATASKFATAVLNWMADFEAKYSRFLPDSLISRINRNAGIDWVEIDPETQQIFALCDQAHFIARGVFDPTALPLIQLWNWKASPPVVPDEDAIATAMKLVGWRKLRRAAGKVMLPAAGMSLDLGGVGKEFAVDRVAQLAVEHGITSALVDFGQDVFTLGSPFDGRVAWHVGLEDPKQPGKCWAGVAVKNQAVATSGDYVRRFELNGKRYGHILDIRTGRPVANGCRAVSVIAPSCTLAGILSTAAFVLGPEQGIRMMEAMPDVNGSIISDHSKAHTRRFYEYVAS